MKTYSELTVIEKVRLHRFFRRIQHKMRYLLMMEDDYLFPVRNEEVRIRRRQRRLRHIPQRKRGQRVR